MRYLYDFGTTSETDIRILAPRQARPLSRHPITQLARNLAPQFACCQECGRPATWWCQNVSIPRRSPAFCVMNTLQNIPARIMAACG